jgi:CO/xanthine dehydrogenase Mo-binding subunit
VRALSATTVLGEPIDRVDGPLKVTGAAPYPSDIAYPDLVHAVLVQSTIGAGIMTAIHAEAAEAASGVLAVITYQNAPALAPAPMTGLGPSLPLPFRDNRVFHHGQHVAIVVAQTQEQAVAAARLLEIDYVQEAAVLGLDNPRAEVLHNPWQADLRRGDPAAALASAEVVVDETYTITAETNNPLGLFATVASWEGDRLTVHDSTQWPVMERQTLATVFDIPESGVRVLSPYLGGGFGAGLRVYPHVILTALAARVVGRPVKLVLARPQMFTSVGHRPETQQRMKLGALQDGRLVAIDHGCTSALGIEGTNFGRVTVVTPPSYDCPNVATHDHQVRLNIPNPGYMRGPGKTEGNFALESALDELSYKLRIDPIELRLRNFAHVHPQSGLPWSSNALQECYRVGAERFGWSKRSPEIGSMREGHWLIGYGMAGVTFELYQPPCGVGVSIHRDGSAYVRSAATDIGTGTYTIAAQLAAELLGLEVGQVNVEIGDSDLPTAPQSGGSGLATSLGGAIVDAAGNLLRAFLKTVADDDRSPLQGMSAEDVAVTNGRIAAIEDSSVGETYFDILERHKLDELSAGGEYNPSAGAPGIAGPAAFAARFAEVHIDPELGLLRIARFVTVVDGGRILNAKTARSQIIGATVMGIGMTLLEETVIDSATGRIANATFGDYLIPVNADVPVLDVVFVGKPDELSPVGSKGLGEIGTVGVSAVIANAVYHATGRRIRLLPITIDKLL